MKRSLRNGPYGNVVTLSHKRFPRRDRARMNERRALAGLTIDETFEFETLDALPPFDDAGNVGWIFEGAPTTWREKRWLELYTRHQKQRNRNISDTVTRGRSA